jgi:hypothetical protein
MDVRERAKKYPAAMPFTSINIYTLKQVRTKRRRYDLEGFQITSPSVCYHLLQYLFDLKSKPVEQFGSSMCIELLDHLIAGEEDYGA